MALISALKQSPHPLPVSSRFTVANGLFYSAFGLLTLAWPGAVQALMLDEEFAGREAGLFRIIGMLLTLIGWFYIFGGRSGGSQFVAATILDRITLVPLILVPLAISGIFPHTLLTFSIIDPVLGGIAWYLLAREQHATDNTCDATEG